MVAIVREETVRRPQELLGDILDDGFDLMFCLEGKALEKLASESTSWWFHTRACPVYARCARPIMASKCVFSVQAFDNNAGVEEGATEEP